jgi:hypothetical protein
VLIGKKSPIQELEIADREPGGLGQLLLRNPKGAPAFADPASNLLHVHANRKPVVRYSPADLGMSINPPVRIGIVEPSRRSGAPNDWHLALDVVPLAHLTKREQAIALGLALRPPGARRWRRKDFDTLEDYHRYRRALIPEEREIEEAHQVLDAAKRKIRRHIRNAQQTLGNGRPRNGAAFSLADVVDAINEVADAAQLGYRTWRISPSAEAVERRARWIASYADR